VNINIIAVGKLEKDYQNIFDKYLKRLSKYHVSVIEIKEAGYLDKDNQIIKESKEIEKHLQNTSNVYILDELGKDYSTLELANIISKLNEITIIIGGSYGLSKELKDKYVTIRLSSLTFPHQLVRVILIEQLYRISTLSNNHPYHH